MSLFHQIIITYDVSDTKLRTKLFNTLKDFGLVSIQKSVMWGYVNYAEEKAIFTYLKNTLSSGDKSLLLQVTNASEQIKTRGIGYSEMAFDTVDTNYVI